MSDQLVPLSLPAGVYDIGTDYDAQGRWHECNLVRFERGSPRPIGGWRRLVDSSNVPVPALYLDPSTEASRSAITWQDNVLSDHKVIGTNAGLYYISRTGVVDDITPAGFTPGSKETGLINGYGAGPYGAGFYGTPRTGSTLLTTPVASWSFSMWGDTLLAQFRNSGPLYQYTPGVDTIAIPVPGAPSDSEAVLVTDQRIAMLIRANGREVVWSDQEDFTTWTPAVTNTAGQFTLSGDGALRELIKVGPDILILSTVDVWVGRYIRPPFVYGFERIGQNVGVYGANTPVTLSSRAYWVGPGGWWTYAAGAGVEYLPCDLYGFFREEAHLPAITKMAGVNNSEHREVFWLFQSQSSTTTEPDTYIAYQADINAWHYGRLDRTCGAPEGPQANPILVTPDGLVFEHELAGVFPDTAEVPFLISGPIQLGQGGHRLGIKRIFPAAEPRAGGISLEFLAKEMPTEVVERVYGPYTVQVTGEPTHTTGLQGRQIRMKVNFNEVTSQLGTHRFEVADVGQR